jgi:hypothetical protein
MAEDGGGGAEVVIKCSDQSHGSQLATERFQKMGHGTHNIDHKREATQQQ